MNVQSPCHFQSLIDIIIFSVTENTDEIVTWITYFGLFDVLWKKTKVEDTNLDILHGYKMNPVPVPFPQNKSELQKFLQKIFILNEIKVENELK